MTKYERTDEYTKLEMSGNIVDITSDIMNLINIVYQRLDSAGNEEVRDAFKDVVTNNINLAFMSDEDVSDKASDIKKKASKELKKAAESLAKCVRSLDEDELDSLFKKGECEDA